MKQPKNVVLLIADSLRFDSVYGTGIGMPYLESKAKQYTQARSAGCWTLPGTASLFTGLLPHEHGATSQTRTVNKDVPTLAEKLKEAGYSTHMVTANVATTEIFNVNRGFDETRRIWQHVDAKYNSIHKFLVLFGKPRLRKILMSKDVLMNRMSEDVDASKTWLQHTHLDTFEHARQILAKNKKENKKSFLFLNLMESHFPYHISDKFKFMNEGIISRIKEIYALFHSLNQTFLTKENPLTQKWMDLLKERQRIAWQSLAENIDNFAREIHEDQEDTLFVFAADHGDNFGDQSWVYHFSNVTDAGTKVPLFWLNHGDNSPETINVPVSSRNVHHGILKACGIPTNEPSIFDAPEETQTVMESFWYNNRGKTLDKYIYNQFCFIEKDVRFLHKNGDWYSAPITEGYDTVEAVFQKLPSNTNPIEEAVADLYRKDRLKTWLKDFNNFSDKVMPNYTNKD